jgi:MFS family permease
MSQSRDAEALDEDPAGPADSTPAPGAKSAAERSLWHDGNFLTLWSGQTFSEFGAQISMLGIPVLAVVLLDATAFQVGVLDAAGLVAFLLIGLPAGVWVDRMRKRHVMIWADAVRAVAIATIPVMWMLGTLHIWQLYAVAFVIGIATVFFDVSYQSVIPSLVRPGQIAEANGKLQATQQVAQLAGPAIGGGLISLVTAPFAMIVTACTYVVSFVALLLTRDHEVLRPANEQEPMVREIGEGLRWVFGNRYLRRIVGTTGTSNFFNVVAMTMVPIFLLRELGMTAAAMGLIFSLGAVGGVVGAIATPHVVRWVGEARAIPLSAIGFSVVGVFLPLAAMTPLIAFPLLVVQSFIAGFTVLVYNITQVTFRQRITPPRLLGRMNASVRFVVWGVMPIASLLSGALGTWLGIVPTMWIGAIGQLLSALFVVAGPFWAMRTLPDAETVTT